MARSPYYGKTFHRPIVLMALDPYFDYKDRVVTKDKQSHQQKSKLSKMKSSDNQVIEKSEFQKNLNDYKRKIDNLHPLPTL